MSILEIRTFPDPILRRRARPVRAIDERIRQLAGDMIETLRNARGVGLAANQVGELKRLVVLQMPEEEDARILVNPAIVRRTGERRVDEGCLSVPGYFGVITRSVKVKARALDDWGSKLRISAEDILAQAIEHEIDHLNGILFLDHLESHEDLVEIGQGNDGHVHDLEYTVEVDHEDGATIEHLQAKAPSSKMGHGASLSDYAFDLNARQQHTAVPPQVDRHTRSSGSSNTQHDEPGSTG